jgi:hypothetical protein
MVNFALKPAMNARGGVDIQLYAFVNLGTRWGGRLALRCGRLYSGKGTRYPLYRGWVGPRAGEDGCEKFPLYRASILEPSNPLPVPIPTTL